MPIFHPYRLLYCILKKINILHQLRLGMAAHRNLIPHPIMLNHIAKRDPSPMRTNRHTKLCRHQNDRHHIIHPRHPYGINLTIPNRSTFKKLLKNHRRSCVLTTSKLKRFLFEAFRKLKIPENVIHFNPNGP